MTVQQRMENLERSQAEFQAKMHQDVDEIKNQMQSLKDNSERNRVDMKEMKDALLGNPEYGIIGKLVDLDEQRALYLKYKPLQPTIDALIEGNKSMTWLLRNAKGIIAVLGTGLVANAVMAIMTWIQNNK